MQKRVNKKFFAKMNNILGESKKNDDLTEI